MVYWTKSASEKKFGLERHSITQNVDSQDEESEV